MRLRRLGNQLFVASPAKLNLFLELLGKRDDGFHDIETIMTTVSLCDDLWIQSASNAGSNDASLAADSLKLIRVSARSVCVDHATDEIPTDQDNLVMKAFSVLRGAAERQLGRKLPGIHATLFKRIPSAAGLGGASSNAAAALVAANLWWNLNWSAERLALLAADLGSDVPFFLTAGTAMCRGRGEIVEPIRGIDGMAVVIVKPSVSFSTPTMFSKVSLAAPRSSQSVARALAAGNTQALGDQLFNRFSEVAESLSDQVDLVRKRFAETPALGHQLSGSGSSYFGLYANHRLARRAARQLAARCPSMNVIQTASLSFQRSITNPDTAA